MWIICRCFFNPSQWCINILESPDFFLLIYAKYHGPLLARRVDLFVFDFFFPFTLPPIKLKRIVVCLLSEVDRRYSPLHGLTSSCCGGLRPTAKVFFPLRAKKGLFMLFFLILDYFLCSVVTSVTLCSNLSSFEKNPINPKNTPKISKIKKSKKIQKSP